jgi:hypothetical protein
LRKMENPKPKDRPKDFSDEWDFSEGFGGIPQDVDLTKNIGCTSGRKKSRKPTVFEQHKLKNE